MDSNKPTDEELQYHGLEIPESPGPLVSNGNCTEKKPVLLAELLAQNEERETHIRQSLCAIRNLHRLVVEETDLQCLIDQTCVNLTETLGCLAASIVLLGKNGKSPMVAAAELGDHFDNVRHRFACGEFPPCMKGALESNKTVIRDNPANGCSDCLLVSEKDKASVLTHSLAYNGTIYGVLTVAGHKCFAGNEEEQNLFKEVAGILAFTLHKREDSEALQESEKRFMDILQASSDAILLIDTDSFVDCNAATAKMLGYSNKEDFLMTHPSKLSPPVQPDGRDSFEKAREMMQIAFKEGFHRFEWTHRKADGEDFPVEVSLTPINYRGKTVLHCLWRDVTKIKWNETNAKALQQDILERQKELNGLQERINQLTKPLSDVSSLRFEDLFSLDEIQKIQDAFAAATGVASIITDPQGVPITKPSHFCHFCIDIIRDTPQGLANCMLSDAALGRMGPGGPVMQPCLSGGLWDGGTAITVGGHHIANWLVGQVLDSSSDPERMVQYAVSVGGDETESRKAIAAEEISRMSVAQFWKVCEALYLIAQQLSKLALQNLMQARHMTEHSREEEERYRLLFETMSQGVIYQSADGTILSVNAVVERSIGVPREKLIGKAGILSSIREDGSPLPDEEGPLMTALRTGKPCSAVLGVHHVETGMLTWGQVKATPLFRPGENKPYQVYCMFDDITEQKKLEQERKEMEMQLLHGQKMEAIGQLAAGIAHEINTPIQFIGDNSRFLQDVFFDLMALMEKYEEIRKTAKQGIVPPGLLQELEELIEEKDLEYIAKEVPVALERTLVGTERVTKIVRAMKDFSHPDGNDRTLLDVNRAIESTITVANNEWKYVATLETDFDPNLPMVRCFPGPFNQVILNIIVNAAHAIGERQEREKSENSSGTTKGNIVISTRQKDQDAEVRISDTGTGIPAAIRNRIFDPFFTTKSVGKGTGQGLALAYSIIVEQHKGSIQVESEENVGTTFVIRIPLKTIDDPTDF